MAIKLMPVALPTPHVEPAHEHPEARAPRKRRRAAVFDADGREVLISLMCLKCHTLRPLSMFGLRKMADGAIRNQPWCRICRGASSAKKNAVDEAAPAVPPTTQAAAPHTVEAVVPPAPTPVAVPPAVASPGVQTPEVTAAPPEVAILPAQADKPQT
jgi:hypothetical protein